MGKFLSDAQTVVFDASAKSNVIHAEHQSLVRIVATEDCWIKVGTDPTATVGGTSTYLPANCVDVILVRANEKIAAIKATTAGSLCITPLS
jgi:hypothetical protein